MDRRRTPRYAPQALGQLLTMRHRWGQPDRPDRHHTVRTCAKCGVLKITRHEVDESGRPVHWIEFAGRDHVVVSPTERTPPCEGTQ